MRVASPGTLKAAKREVYDCEFSEFFIKSFPIKYRRFISPKHRKSLVKNDQGLRLEALLTNMFCIKLV